MLTRGAIRIHQEMKYDGRKTGTDLTNPDFAAFALSFGAHGECVERTDDFAAAFERAVKCKGPALIEIRIDPDAINTRYTLSSLNKNKMK